MDIQLERLRTWLRKKPVWLNLRKIQREGIRHAWRRIRVQGQILKTDPIRTAHKGSVEVRVLTWSGDWVDLIWALKSFYYFAKVDYPLFIHDGGLTKKQIKKLKQQFPDADIISQSMADTFMEKFFHDRNLLRCLAYRNKNITTRKLFDFHAMSNADYIINIDSDILFFQGPEALIVPPDGIPCNLYNKDCGYYYSLSLDELESAFGIRPLPFINSGLCIVQRQSVDFAAIERWLADPKLFENEWITEQTLHALISTRRGVELLPDTYCVASKPGITPEMVCKHYPGGACRHLLFDEGTLHMINMGFLDLLKKP